MQCVRAHQKVSAHDVAIWVGARSTRVHVGSGVAGMRSGDLPSRNDLASSRCIVAALSSRVPSCHRTIDRREPYTGSGAPLPALAANHDLNKIEIDTVGGAPKRHLTRRVSVNRHIRDGG